MRTDHVRCCDPMFKKGKNKERERENAFSALSKQPGRARYLSDSCLLCWMRCCMNTCQWYRLTCSYRPHFISARYRFDFDGGTFRVSRCVYTRGHQLCIFFTTTTPPPQTPLENYAVIERYICAVVSLWQETWLDCPTGSVIILKMTWIHNFWEVKLLDDVVTTARIYSVHKGLVCTRIRETIFSTLCIFITNECFYNYFVDI